MQQDADWLWRLGLGRVEACLLSTTAPRLNCSWQSRRRVAAPNTLRFATAAEAVRYAVEDLQTPKAFGAWLEVGDERFNSSEIQRLYEAEDYPLRKPE